MTVSPTVRIDVSGARGESTPDTLRRTGQYGVLPTDTDALAMDKFAAVAEVAAFDQAERSKQEADQSNLARLGAEGARDTAKAWAEGPVPVGGTRSSKGWAEVAQVNAAVSDNARSAVELAISQVPSDTTLMLEAVSTSVLRGVASSTPIGRLAYLSEPGREGVWQFRAGDYSAKVAADVFGARYIKVTAIAANVAAWERIIVGNLFRFSWTGLNADTIDALPFLKSAISIFDANAKWELPPHLIRIVGSGDPRLAFNKANVDLYGFGRATHFDYAGAAENFVDSLGLIQIAASGITLSNVHVSNIAPNNSANNPACVAVYPGTEAAATAVSLPDLTGVTIRDISFDRTSTGVIVGAYVDSGYTTFKRPKGVLVENVEGRSNGAAVSFFGAEDFEARDCRFQYDPSLPSNSTAAKRMGFRVLGSVNGRLNSCIIRDYDFGVNTDAAYFGRRAKNKDLTVKNLAIYNCKTPFNVVECEGLLDISDILLRRPMDTVDNAGVMGIAANAPISTIPAEAPAEDKVTSVGDVCLRRVDAEGYAIGVIQQGSMGKLTIEDCTIAGNNNVDNTTFQRGAFFATGSFGSPKMIRINGNDFRQTVASSAASILAQTEGGVIEIRDNMLPERLDPEASILVLDGVVYTDKTEQRPFNGVVNLGENTVHPVGALANYIDGTALPAATITSAAWTRNLVNVTEGPTGTFTKSAGGMAWNAAVYSTEAMVGDFEIVYKVSQVTPDLIVGLTQNYVDPGYGSMDHAIYYNGAASIYLRGPSQIAQTRAYSAGTIERWRRDGTRLIFSRGNVDLLETTISPDMPLKLQVSFARQGDAVEVLRFGSI